jgi:hypothetical protein
MNSIFNNQQIIKEYLDNIQKTINRGDAREESYYEHLKSLIKSWAEQNNLKKVDITILPKQTEAGNPDFRIWDGKNHITGYIEAKDPSITNLDRIEDSGQLIRYITTFPNVILTNFYEFRLYRNGEKLKTVTIARPVIAQKIKVAPPIENVDEFYNLLDTFFSFSLPKVSNAKELARELAKRTRFLRDEVITIEIAQEEKKGQQSLLGFYEAFKNFLIGTLTTNTFADLYSQTLTYGLFAARTRANGEFNRELAFKYIPNTIGILRDIFRYISLEDPPIQLQTIVDDISEVLNVTDVNKILQDFYFQGKGEDPIVHFYETFLTEYDPKIREKRGVYYTPEAVVSYIVRSINDILKSHFSMNDGLASREVTLLDPAAGTLTFPAEAVKLAVKEYTDKYGSGGKNNFIKTHILENYFAFELMMAPYAIGHIKMSFLLEELGYKLADDERFKLYLTNTLEMEDLAQISIPGLSSLSEESHSAAKVKQDPILVILGNPPYSGISANMTEWTDELLKTDKDGAQSYYKVDDMPLGEKNPKWLQDDYVKFLRFAQWKIHKAGRGIVGMITNHSYLNNPTFRGMRQSLMNTFNKIYIIDLHGNSLKKEKAPDGSKDENIFDIRQGVAIGIFVKHENKKGCKVYHKDLWGLREEKYNWLKNNDFNVKDYVELEPATPWYFFIPRNVKDLAFYLDWMKVNEIFPINVTGIVTARDSFAIDFDKQSLRNRIIQFRNKSLNDEMIRDAFKLKDTCGWKLSEARRKLQNDENWDTYYKKILYRPFDVREIYYTPLVIEGSRLEVMQHMLKGNNLGLITTRQVAETSFNHCFISKNIIESRITLSNKGIAYLFPLYLYTDSEQNKKRNRPFYQTMSVFESKAEYSAKKPNIDQKLYDKLNKTYKKNISPEEILYYIYAILYSNIYRKKYVDFLTIDFPRIPFTKDYKLFSKISEFGHNLTSLHLVESQMLNKIISKYEGESTSDKIEKIVYDEINKKIYINKDKYFSNVESEVWNYYIGGYQVLPKYLKERIGKTMDNPEYFCKVISSIYYTIDIQKNIDQIYLDVEKDFIKFT